MYKLFFIFSAALMLLNPASVISETEDFHLKNFCMGGLCKSRAYFPLSEEMQKKHNRKYFVVNALTPFKVIELVQIDKMEEGFKRLKVSYDVPELNGLERVIVPLVENPVDCSTALSNFDNLLKNPNYNFAVCVGTYPVDCKYPVNNP